MIDTRLNVPPGWTDKSMLAYALADLPASGVAPNIVVTRDTLSSDLPEGPNRMTQYVQKQLALMQSQLSQLAVLEMRPISIGQWPAVRLVVTWQAQQTTLTQTVTFIDAGQGQALIATATCASSEFPQFGPVLDEMIQTLRRSS